MKKHPDYFDHISGKIMIIYSKVDVNVIHVYAVVIANVHIKKLSLDMLVRTKHLMHNIINKEIINQ